MPVACKRNIEEVKSIIDESGISSGKDSIEAQDLYGNVYQLPSYYVYVFRKEIPIILFYLSKGLDYALDYLNVSNVIRFINKLPSSPDFVNNIYFQLSNKCVMEVDKKMFLKYPYIQSVVGGFVTVSTNRVTIDQLNDPKQWIKRIANPNNYEKGYGILKYFNRLLDETTKKVLKVPEYHSEDIYALLRWINLYSSSKTSLIAGNSYMDN